MTPPITAICLTLPGREGMLRRAVESFRRQKYDGVKKLMVYADNVLHAERLQRSFPVGDDVDVYPALLSVWEKLHRAVAEAKARGGLTAIWDDDDTYHPLRLQRQADAAKPGRPCYLSSAIWQFFDSDEVFITDREERHKDLQSRIIPQTFVACVEDVPEPTKRWNWSGSPTATLGRVLQDKTKDSDRCGGEWWWARMGVRGDNAQGYEWHRGVGAGNKAQTIQWLAERRSLVEKWFDEYLWDGGSQLDVCGRDGMAYKFTPRKGWPGYFPPLGGPQGIEVVIERPDDKGTDAQDQDQQAS